MDAIIYVLIALTSISTILLIIGRLDVLKVAFCTAFVCAPFGFATMFLMQTGVI